ncbi:MAG TPA: hypothetical protein VE993_01600 [Stellaceae bacterium]|nr:hypothetical protein [Stellaceae bacterium]
MRNLKVLLGALALATALFGSAAVAAVVNTYGQGEVNPKNTATNPVAVDEIFAAAHAKAILSTIAVNSTDSANSIYHVGFIPTNAVIDPSSLVYGSGITGLTSMSCGFGANPQVANPLGTWAAAPAALVSAQDWHTAASFSLVQAVSVTNYEQQVFQLLGLTLDPGGVVEVYCTVNTGPSAAGTLQFVLKYFDRK